MEQQYIVQNQNNIEETEIDLQEVVQVLLAKVWIILLAGVLAAVAGFLYTNLFVTPMYRSTSTIYLINKQDSSTSITTSEIQSSTSLAKDFAHMAVKPNVLNDVITDLGLDMTYDQLMARVQVSIPTDTRILEFTVEDEDPEKAKVIVDKLVEVASEKVKSAMNLQEVNVSDKGGVAAKPYNINTKRNVVLGFVIGFFLAAAVVLAMHFLDDSVKTAEDVENYLGLSTLGSLPMMGTGNRGNKYGRYE